MRDAAEVAVFGPRNFERTGTERMNLLAGYALNHAGRSGRCCFICLTLLDWGWFSVIVVHGRGIVDWVTRDFCTAEGGTFFMLISGVLQHRNVRCF